MDSSFCLICLARPKGSRVPVICRGNHSPGSTPSDHVGNHLGYPGMLAEGYEQVGRRQLAGQEFISVVDYCR
jgi:hypothetical protein